MAVVDPGYVNDVLPPASSSTLGTAATLIDNIANLAKDASSFPSSSSSVMLSKELLPLSPGDELIKSFDLTPTESEPDLPVMPAPPSVEDGSTAPTARLSIIATHPSALPSAPSLKSRHAAAVVDPSTDNFRIPTASSSTELVVDDVLDCLVDEIADPLDNTPVNTPAEPPVQASTTPTSVKATAAMFKLVTSPAATYTSSPVRRRVLREQVSDLSGPVRLAAMRRRGKNNSCRRSLWKKLAKRHLLGLHEAATSEAASTPIHASSNTGDVPVVCNNDYSGSVSPPPEQKQNAAHQKRLMVRWKTMLRSTLTR